MPQERESITHKFSIAGHEGYITAGKYEDGSVGEIFLTDIGKEGSTIKGMMNAFATAVSIGLQYGVPLETFVKKFSYMRFEPEGITGNPEIPFAKSMPDYIMRWVASRFIDDLDDLEDLGILTPEVRARKEDQQALFSEDSAGPGNGHSGNGANGHSKAAPRSTSPDEGRPGGGGPHRHSAGPPGRDGRQGARPGLRAVRRDDAAHGLVLHVLVLRQQHRLRLSCRASAGLITRRSRVQIPPPLLTKGPLRRAFRHSGPNSAAATGHQLGINLSASPRQIQESSPLDRMNSAEHNKIVSFIWGIADDVLRDLYVRGKYRDVILPMVVLRRFDALLEPTNARDLVSELEVVENLLDVLRSLRAGRVQPNSRGALIARAPLPADSRISSS